MQVRGRTAVSASPGESVCIRLGSISRRRPERTLAYQTVQAWLATWIAYREATDDEAVPAYIERELKTYLECGILAHGFAQARCPDCTAEFLVAFARTRSRRVPSATTKRMAATAARILIDSVIPRVPMRQWVLALPKRLRPALRDHAALATRVLRIFIGSIQRELRRSAAPVGARIGAVGFLQRFGSALNEHWHYHCCVSDGVFAAADGKTLAFVPATVDVADIVARVQARVRGRVLALYCRHGVLSGEDAAQNMAGWDHGGGFSVDASVGIAADDLRGAGALATLPAPGRAGHRTADAGRRWRTPDLPVRQTAPGR